MKHHIIAILILGLIPNLSCHGQQHNVLPGAEATKEYFPLIAEKSIGLVANQSSLVRGQHLLDFLLSKQNKVMRVFSPEHGFRGTADAGEKINSTTDSKTGIPIVSLYGKSFKPKTEDLQGIEVMIFDIQDVGVRFYTYISTLHYVMEACSEANIPLIVLDRPNPNAHYVDGPILEKEYASFVGMHQVPVVYGLSIGEYAKMINGESWLKGNLKCQLTVIPCKNWNRNCLYELPVKPSPNLPNALSVALYPSLCFFEGTVVSAGRGTKRPFQCFGHPKIKKASCEFTPQETLGAKHPKFKGQKCYGTDLSSISLNELRSKQQLQLSYLLNAYKQLSATTQFFNPFFEKLAGNKKLRTQIERGLSEKEIRASWQNDLKVYKKIRSKYLIYPEGK